MVLSRLEREPTDPNAKDACDYALTTLPAYRMEEDTTTVKWLLQLCYPDQPPVLPDGLSPEQSLAVLGAALKYNSKRAEGTLRSQWAQRMKPKPLLFYFFAVTRGWKDEALLCARELVATAQSIAAIEWFYIPQMENVQNHTYLDLLTYTRGCVAAATLSFDIRGLPGSPCAGWQCAARYPDRVWSGGIPPWLQSTFLTSTGEALRQRPYGATISSSATTLLAVVAADEENCSAEAAYRTSKAGRIYQATPERVCLSSVSHRIEWANAFLMKYAEAVDSLVAVVRMGLLLVTARLIMRL